MSEPANLIEITVRTLREKPEDWTFTRYEAKNEKLDIVVWIANGLFALRINGPGIFTSQEPKPFTGWLIPWRRAVLKAVRDAAESQLLQRFEEVYPHQAGALPQHAKT